jgi:hypothetical protein
LTSTCLGCASFSWLPKTNTILHQFRVSSQRPIPNLNSEHYACSAYQTLINSFGSGESEQSDTKNIEHYGNSNYQTVRQLGFPIPCQVIIFSP